MVKSIFIDNFYQNLSDKVESNAKFTFSFKKILIIAVNYITWM